MPKKRLGNQHNHRHENGIVAPGKRITKQKSNGHINGSAVGVLSTAAVTDPSASVDHATNLTTEKQMNGHSKSGKDGVSEAQNHVSNDREGLSSELEPPQGCFGLSNGTLHVQSSKPGKIPPTGLAKNNALHLALTIIKSCPLADTLTILIILLSIPSTILTLMNTLFAMLTFMPPASSLFSLPNSFSDIFQGSGGTPSVATIIITDIIGLLIWLVAWTPVQTLAIEYSQAVMAATLGGSNTNKKTGYDSTFLCMAIVTARHISRRAWIPARVLGFDWRAVLSRIPYIPENPNSFISFSDDDLFTTDPRGGWGWFRILVALHILIQGLVHVARRWYQRKEYFQPASVGKRTDPEAGANNMIRPGPNPLADSSLSGSNTPSPAMSPKTSLPLVKDTREKASSGKKRRKQAAQVRSQQPLWAAIAATKVTIMREYEQTNAMTEFSHADATDANDLGNAKFSNTQNQTWVSEVHPDSFVFNTTYPAAEDSRNDEANVEAGARVDRSKPFYVRVNETDWTSTRLSKCDKDKHGFTGWSCVVFGLAPSSSYRCSLVSSEGDVLLFTVTVTTSSSLLEESESNTTPGEVTQRAQRPYSPTSPSTTLKKSISAYEASLTDVLARQKRSKKENKATLSGIKKEIEILNAKIAKLASEDRSHTNRHMQWNQHKKQADEAVNAISQEIEALEAIPQSETQVCRDKRSLWEETEQRQKAVKDEISKCKASAQREKSMAQNELNAARQKKDRLEARKLKLSDQLEKLESASARGLPDKDRKHLGPTSKKLQRMRLEEDLQKQWKALKQVWQESQYITAQLNAHAQQLEHAFHEQHMMSNHEVSLERPLTPEGDLPGENPRNSAAAAPPIAAFGTPESSGLRSHSGSLRHLDHRLRSSSLQSSHSNYVDFDDHDSARPMPFRAVEAIREVRKRSGGSVGGSSESNSQRDPASPTGGNRAQEIPLGKKSPVWNN